MSHAVRMDRKGSHALECQAVMKSCEQARGDWGGLSVFVPRPRLSLNQVEVKLSKKEG